MKWLLAPILWLLAVCLAVFVVWRLMRGNPIVLRGRLAPRAIRLAAVLLVVLGVEGDRKAQAVAPPKNAPKAPIPSPEPPVPFTAAQIEQWVHLTERDGGWALFKRELTQLRLSGNQENKPAKGRIVGPNLPPRLNQLLRTELDMALAGKQTKVPAVRDLSATLAEAEKAGYYDGWLTAYLWREAGRSEGDEEARLDLHRRLAWHACMTNALIRARPLGGDLALAPVAWRNKAGGPMRGQVLAQQAGMKAILKAANSLFRHDDLGTWEKDGLAAFALEKGSPAATRFHGSQKSIVEPGEAFVWRRLDLLKTKAGNEATTLVHPTYGKVVAPASKLVSVWELPQYLSEDGRKRVAADVEKALDDDESAAGRLEKALPLAHRGVRDGLGKRPGAKGASRLRLILALFDDEVTSAPVPLPAVGGALERDFRRR